jgi:hypothetical protein
MVNIMTKIEIAKVKALRECQIVRGSSPAKFLIALSYMVDQKISRMLSHGQKYYLDELVWNYRVQLATMDAIKSIGFPLPQEKPDKSNYRAIRRSPQEQLAL